MTTITRKQESLYVAYALEFDVAACGSCQDEALNNLTDEIQERKRVPTGDEKIT